MDLNSWFVRAAIVAGVTWLGYKYAPAGVGKTIALAIGGVSVAGIVGANVPLVRMALTGQLPAPAAA